MKEVTIEEVEKNWSIFAKLCGRLSDSGINRLIEELGQRIASCPSSTRESEVGCHVGGLVKTAIDVTAAMRTLNSSFSLELPVSSILKVGLLHELGKVGDEDNDLFVEQDSDWHREKLGQHYKYNEDVDKMSVSHRTLYLLQKYGVALSREEWIAIQLSQGSHFEENRFYVGSEPTLALILQQARAITHHKALN